jgi:hypothetical protein
MKIFKNIKENTFEGKREIRFQIYVSSTFNSLLTRSSLPPHKILELGWNFYTNENALMSF